MKQTRFTIIMSIILSCYACKKEDQALERHFNHWKKNLDPTALMEFKALAADSIYTYPLTVENVMKLYRRECDSTCQVGMMDYFDKHYQGHYYYKNKNLFVLLAFHKWLNNQSINHDRIIQRVRHIVLKNN